MLGLQVEYRGLGNGPWHMGMSDDEIIKGIGQKSAD